MKYNIKKVREGEEQKYLDEGWEPFAVVAVNSSYECNNGKNVVYQSTVYIYLRRLHL